MYSGLTQTRSSQREGVPSKQALKSEKKALTISPAPWYLASVSSFLLHCLFSPVPQWTLLHSQVHRCIAVVDKLNVGTQPKQSSTLNNYLCIWLVQATKLGDLGHNGFWVKVMLKTIQN